MKGELGGKTMTKLVGLKTKTHSYLIHLSSSEDNKKWHRKVCHKKKT